MNSNLNQGHPLSLPLRKRRVSFIFFLIMIQSAVFGFPEEAPGSLSVARAIDQEIMQLKNLPDNVRAAAIKKLAQRIRRQPSNSAMALALNLAIDGANEGADQAIADTIAHALPQASPKYIQNAYHTLAELARYNHIRVMVNNDHFTAAMRQLEEEDRQRRSADFTLEDIDGIKWCLTSLHGKVVMVIFWATWCPPCRKEIPDLEAIYNRFKKRGLIILTISDEDPIKLRQFVAEQKVSFPLLLDPGGKTKGAFLVRGFPASFVYNRLGQLMGQTFGSTNRQGMLLMLEKAGIK